MTTLPKPTLAGVLASIEAIHETPENFQARREAIRDTQALITKALFTEAAK